MSNQVENFNILKQRVETLGKAVFGCSFSYRVLDESHCDPSIDLYGVTSLGVCDADEPGAPMFYWGVTVYNPGSREEPPSEDFDERGYCHQAGHQLDKMLLDVFKFLVEFRWSNQLDVEADAQMCEDIEAMRDIRWENEK